jgi:hypothetical protein
MNNYTFVNHPIEMLHSIIPELLPGVGKIITVHYDETSNKFVGILSEKTNHDYCTQWLNIQKIVPELQHYFDNKNPIDWFDPENLPFDIEVKRPNPGIDLFSELNNVVLLVRITNESNSKDLVFIYLEENPSNFGVTDTDKPLSSENKGIIAFLLNHSINVFVNLHKRNKTTLNLHNVRTRQIINQTESMKDEMLKTKENYGVSLVKLCQQIIYELSLISRKKYRLSPGALEKIKNYKGEIKDLEMIIRHTISYIDSLYVDHQNEIDILEWHLIFEKPIIETTLEPAKSPEYEIYARTISLLDRLEDAALVIKSNKKKLTGTNVGSAFPKPITAPAISDALYNHRNKINSLVKKFPEKWVTIKNDFKPLKNILRDELPES